MLLSSKCASKRKPLDNSGTSGWYRRCSSELFTTAVSTQWETASSTSAHTSSAHCRSQWAVLIYWLCACPHCTCQLASASSWRLLPTYYSLSFFASQVWICWLCGLFTSCGQHACPSIVITERQNLAATEHPLSLLIFFPPIECLSARWESPDDPCALCHKQAFCTQNRCINKDVEK